MSLEKYLKELCDEQKPLKHILLEQLSGLTPEAVFEFRDAWRTLSQQRKCEVLSRLVELSEDNLELDFSQVFRSCLADEDESVREKAALGLSDCDDRVIIRPLVGLLQSDPAPRVRAAAATSLGKFAELAQEGKLISRDAERIRDALLAVIDKPDEDIEVRRRAIEAASCFNTPQIQKIIRDAYNSPNPKLKQSAIFAMGRNSDPQWLPIILEEMTSTDPAIRYEAAMACGQIGDESTVPHLIRLIKDEDLQVQLAAIDALGNIGGPLAKRALQQCLKSGDEAVEEAAQAALGNIEFEEDPLSFRFQA